MHRPSSLAFATACLAALPPLWLSACARGPGAPEAPAELSVTLRTGPVVDLGPPPPTSDLLVLYTGMVQGFIEPCGCIAGQIGGIDRIAGYVEDQLAEHPAGLFVDLGDLFARDTHPDPALEEQLPIKARGFFETWGRIGCAGIAVGETDLLVGAETLNQLSEQFSVPLLCANLVDREGRLVFRESVTVERGGKRIGLFSVIAPDLTETEVAPHAVLPVNVERLARKAGLEITPWRQAAERVIGELSKTCDVVILASHLNFDRNRELAESFPQLDLVLGGHWDENPRPTSFIKRTPVLVAQPKGSRLGRVEWWWREPEAYFKANGRGRVEDVTERIDLRGAALAEAVQFADMEGRDGAFSADHYTIKRGNHELMAQRYLADFRALPPFPESGNLFSHYQVPLHTFLRRSEIALQAIDRYHQEQHDHWQKPSEVQRDIAASRVFVGADACRSCHPLQHEFWLATRHSRAIYALKATLQDTDAECIGCHTVGYRQSGGFNHPGRYGDFANVQCAACHGPGGPHVEGGASFLDKTRILGNGTGVAVDGKPGCFACHEKEHDPHFEQESAQRLAAVACPPMEPAGGGTSDLRFAYRRGAMLLESLGAEAPWAVVTDAYLQAGDIDDSLRTAELWRQQAPRAKQPMYVLGDRYLRAGRSVDAEEVFGKLVNREPESAQAWLGYGRALVERDPDRAQHAGLEAYSLAPGVEPVRLVAEAALNAGRTQQARDSVQAFLELRPDARPELQDLLERMP